MSTSVYFVDLLASISWKSTSNWTTLEGKHGLVEERPVGSVSWVLVRFQYVPTVHVQADTAIKCQEGKPETLTASWLTS